MIANTVLQNVVKEILNTGKENIHKYENIRKIKVTRKIR